MVSQSNLNEKARLTNTKKSRRSPGTKDGTFKNKALTHQSMAAFNTRRMSPPRSFERRPSLNVPTNDAHKNLRKKSSSSAGVGNALYERLGRKNRR